MSEPSRHLVLVHSEGWQDVADFHAIKAHVERMAPDIAVFIASNARWSSLTRKKAARRPTLVFSPIQLAAFQPTRGTIYQGRPMSKLAEMRRLAEAGVRVPPFEELGPQTVLSPDVYGPLVIVKPSFALASWGQGVELRRTTSVRYRARDDFPQSHPGRHGPMLVQRFIDCGYPMTCRVLTLFGTPLFTYVRKSIKPLALAPDKDHFEQVEYMPAPPNRISFVTKEPDFLDFAASVYAAMPDVALQACDILREKETGHLYLLEVNPGGGTWMFSSEAAAGYRQMLGVADLTHFFDAFRTCARVLVERTRAEAR